MGRGLRAQGRDVVLLCALLPAQGAGAMLEPFPSQGDRGITFSLPLCEVAAKGSPSTKPGLCQGKELALKGNRDASNPKSHSTIPAALHPRRTPAMPTNTPVPEKCPLCTSPSRTNLPQHPSPAGAGAGISASSFEGISISLGVRQEMSHPIPSIPSQCSSIADWADHLATQL